MQDIIAADEVATHPDGPACRGNIDGQVFLDLVDDLEGVAAFPVHLVAEGQDRQVAQAAHLEQFARLAFHTLGPVDHHDRGIHGRQRAVGVFGKITVAGGINQIEAVGAKIKRHGRGRDGNAAFLFQLHVVRPGAARLALGADLTGHLNGTAEQKELFGQRGFAGVGMRDDRKGPAAGNFGRKGGGVRSVQHGAASSANCGPRPPVGFGGVADLRLCCETCPGWDSGRENTDGPWNSRQARAGVRRIEGAGPGLRRSAGRGRRGPGAECARGRGAGGDGGRSAQAVSGECADSARRYHDRGRSRRGAGAGGRDRHSGDQCGRPAPRHLVGLGA